VAQIKNSDQGFAPRRGAIFEVIAFVQRASEVARQRRQLRQLDDAALKDFGASRADAWEEGGKAWWNLPREQQKG
jgi:uncharacterized protein YjiS (DUF1127 family)